MTASHSACHGGHQNPEARGMRRTHQVSSDGKREREKPRKRMNKWEKHDKHLLARCKICQVSFRLSDHSVPLRSVTQRDKQIKSASQSELNYNRAFTCRRNLWCKRWYHPMYRNRLWTYEGLRLILDSWLAISNPQLENHFRFVQANRICDRSISTGETERASCLIGLAACH